MAEKRIIGRAIQKHDVEANWLKATNFIPLQGEIIVYDIDEKYNYERLKIGDGVQNVNSLPFYANSWEDLSDKPFGEVEGKNYLVEETSIVLGESMGWTETYVPTTCPFYGFVEGQVYYVVFDGKVYSAGYDSDIDGLGIEAIDIEVYYGGNDEMTVCTASSDPRRGETHTFGMYTTELVMAQLDEQYIPNTIARVNDIEVHNTSETAHSDIRTSISDVSALVGDTAVSEQINTAIAAIPDGFSGSWHDLEDRPLVMESVTITYDGSTDGYVTSNPTGLYKVSDLVLAKENVIGQRLSILSNGSINTIILTEDMIIPFEDPKSFLLSDCVVCVAEDNTVFNEAMTFPEKGVYFYSANNMYVTSLVAANVAEVFDEKYIPYSIARLEDIVQSDWSDGNVSSLSYVKNKTHYYCEGAPLVEELSFTVTDEDFTRIGPYITFEEGKKYKVVIDGVLDMCTAVHIEDAAAAKNYIELTPTIDGFGMVRSRLSGGICTYIAGVSVGDHVLSIYEDDELQQLDEMFIPATIARTPKITAVTLTAANWTGDANPWSQVVTVNGVTANSKVDLQPTAIQIVEMQDNDIALMAENNDGVITVYAIGSKPTVDYTMQALITEVAVV